MKNRNVMHAVLALLLALCMAHSAYAVTEFGKNPYYQPPLQSVADLKQMVADNPADIKTGLTKAGNGDIYDSFMAQLPDAEVKSVDYAKGQEFKWMLYRKNGKGPVRVDKVLTYDGDMPVAGYEFFIDHEGDRYTFAVPLVCGNLALLNVGPTPPPEPKPEPEPVVAAPVEQPVEEVAKLMPWVVDLGLMYQTDPATYLIARGGYEHFFAENWSVLGMIGFAPKLEGADGTSALLIDVFANYYFSKAWVGLGLGGWLTDEDDNDELDDDDSDLDVMLNLGYQLYEKPNSYKLSGFVEVRSAVDELDDFDLYGRVGAGLRIHF